MVPVVVLVLALTIATLAGVGVLATRLLAAVRSLATTSDRAGDRLRQEIDELTDEVAVTSLEAEQLRSSIVGLGSTPPPGPAP